MTVRAVPAEMTEHEADLRLARLLRHLKTIADANGITVSIDTAIDTDRAPVYAESRPRPKMEAANG